MNNKIDCTDIEDMIKYYANREEHEKHLKGYMYDSLVYRYKEALYKAHLYDAQKRGESFRKQPYDRDFMRFIQILDEAIGAHD